MRELDARGWYFFLRDAYFPRKFTARNVCVANVSRLRRYLDEDRLAELDDIRRRLLAFDPREADAGLRIAGEIHGLGVKSASGLLALMYPENFGTVDKFVVEALREVGNLPEADAVRAMDSDGPLTPADGVILIRVMRRKAAELNSLFATTWTPRKIDKVLWACRQ